MKVISLEITFQILQSSQPTDSSPGKFMLFPISSEVTDTCSVTSYTHNAHT